jgi:hypothetical protein
MKLSDAVKKDGNANMLFSTSTGNNYVAKYKSGEDYITITKDGAISKVYLNDFSIMQGMIVYSNNWDEGEYGNET